MRTDVNNLQRNLEPAIRALTCGLESAGWSIRCFELDMTTERAKIELVRTDGPTKRVVTFFARDGRATIERFSESRETIPIGRRGDRFLADRLRTDFLGRQSFVGCRAGLRNLCSYISDNSNRHLSAGDVRSLLSPMMALPCSE